jgi:putative flippase GtrA
VSRYTLGEFLLIGIIASAVQFLGQYVFTQIVKVPALAIFFGFKPAPVAAM